MLDHLPEVGFLSSVELAQRAGVSQPSVTRFAAALGFAGYPELRRALRPHTPAPEPGLFGEVNEFQAGVDVELRALRALREQSAEPALLRRLGRQLVLSQPLPVLGLRTSAPLALAFAQRAQRLHPDVRAVSSVEAVEDELPRAARAGASWLFAFVLPPYPSATVTALESARGLGLRCAVVTDRPLVSFAPLADELLAAGGAPGNRPEPFESPVVAFTASMLVLRAMVEAEPRRARRRLEEHARWTRANGAFLSE